MSTNSISEGSTVLVTGVNGFIASHIADQLLQDGYKVRGSVRSRSRGEAVHQQFVSKYGSDRFELSVVEDVARESAFDQCLEGVSGVIHTATSATFEPDPETVIPQTVAGALNVLKSAIKVRSVKSIVYTSDSFAALLPQPNQAIEITSLTYNEDSVKVAEDVSNAAIERVRDAAWDKSSAFELHVYAAAKVAAEKAIWKFVEEQRPMYQVSTILPNINLGGSVSALPLSSTGTCIPNLLSEETSNLLFPAQYYVNVRDCARLHVAALLDPSAANERIFAMAGPFNWNEVLAILRRLLPERIVMDDLPELGRDLSVVPNERAEQLLRKWYGHGWTSLKESVIQNVESYERAYEGRKLGC